MPHMDYTLVDLVTLGLVAIMVALSILLAMVHLELGPAVRLARRRRWLLSVALGSGILAFAFKLVLIVALANFPEYMIEPLLDSEEVVHGALPAPARSAPPRYRWTTLPERRKAASFTATASSPTGYVWRALPEQAPSPADNPATADKIALGEKLFFDPNLSRDGTVSCASCHDLHGAAGGDGRATSLGIDRQIGPRNAPTVWNAAFQAMLFWDGRASSLEEQAKGPLVNPVEMGMPSLAAVEERVRQKVEYQEAFAAAFGAETPITIDHIAEAIAAYERTLITPDTPYDRFVRGDLDALTPAQLRGMGLFQSLGCVSCHYGPNFSAASVFDSHTPRRIFPTNPTPYEQRYRLLVDGGERGVWRVPSLRNVALTGPWLHNGAVNELQEVVRIMAAAQLGRAGRYLLWSDREGTLNEINRPSPTDQEVSDIVAFLNALSSDRLSSQEGNSNTAMHFAEEP